MAALARIAGRLEGLVAELDQLRRSLDEDREARPARIERYRQVREEARLYRWYLEVQRESLGLLRHEDLDRLYPIPEPL